MQVLNQRCVRISRSSCARESRKPAQVYAQVQKTACTLYTYIIHVYRSLQYRPVVGPLPIPSISPDSPAKLDPDPSPTRKTRDFVSFCLFLVFDILHGKKESRWTRPVDSGRGNSLRHPPPPLSLSLIAETIHPPQPQTETETQIHLIGMNLHRVPDL
jgi:hypothetical protein